MKTYKPGTLVEYVGSSKDGIEEDLIIIGKQGVCYSEGLLYDVYNITHGLFMERSQSFLDKYYTIVVE